MRFLVIIPSYNEALNIRWVIKNLFSELDKAINSDFEVNVLVVDDNSPDGTAAIVQEMQNEPAGDRINLLTRAAKEGLASAYLTGFKWAKNAGYDYVVEMDADGSHQAADIPLLLQRAVLKDKPDLVIGSRWVRGGEVVNWPKHRELLSRLGNAYVGAWLSLKVADATAGFRVYKIAGLNKIDFKKVSSHGYYFQVLMTQLVDESGGHIVEVPISFCERKAGESKMSTHIIVEALAQATLSGMQKRGKQLKNLGLNTISAVKRAISKSKQN